MQIPGWVRRRLRWKAVPPSLLLLWDVLKKASDWICTGIKTGGDLDFLGLWDPLVGFVKEWDGLIVPAIGVAWLWWIGREARGKAAPIERNRTQGAFDNGLLKIPTGRWLHQTVYDVDYTMLDETSPKIRFRISIFNGSRKFIKIARKDPFSGQVRYSHGTLTHPPRIVGNDCYDRKHPTNLLFLTMEVPLSREEANAIKALAEKERLKVRRDSSYPTFNLTGVTLNVEATTGGEDKENVEMVLGSVPI